MEYSLKNLGFCSFLPVEDFEQGALRKELIIVPSIKHFKAKRVLESRFNEVAGLKACNFIKKRFQHRCFPVKFAKIFKNIYLEEHLRTTAFGRSY